MDEGRELAYPPPTDGLTYAEAGYERRVDAPDVFSGFRCRDYKYSVSPAEEERLCSFIKKTINNPRGCCTYYVARNIGEIKATFQPADPYGELAIHVNGVRKVVRGLAPTAPERRTALGAVLGLEKDLEGTS